MSHLKGKNANYAEAKGYKQIRNYKLFDPPIGEGTTGVVYKAWDSKKNFLVAIKSINNKLLKDEIKMKAFQNEVKALHSLKHENIIKIFSVEKTANNIYIALEYCNCDSLSSLLQYFKYTYNACVPEALVQIILKQLIEGLSFMHSKKHMHRDLKLDNVLIHFPNEYEKENFQEYEQNNFEGLCVKIADLGYAKEFQTNDLASTLCGTPIFMAAELVMNHLENKRYRGYNMKADLWSLGALTYEMLVGEPPFGGTDLNNLFENISEGKYNYKKSCMISLEAISFINGLLTFNEDNRFTFKEMKDHPFIKNHPSTFHPLDLSIVPESQIKNNKIEIDSKDMENFLWAMYKCDGLKNLDKIKTNDLNDKEIMQSVRIINENIVPEKKNLLNIFRQSKRKSKNKLEEESKNIEKVGKTENSLEKIPEEVERKESEVAEEIEKKGENLNLNKVEESNGINKEKNEVAKVFQNEKEEDNAVNNDEENQIIIEKENNQMNNENAQKLIDDLQPKQNNSNPIPSNTNEEGNNPTEIEIENSKSIIKYSSYIQLDNRKKIEEQIEDDEILEILSCYSLIERDEDWPTNGKDVEVQSFIDIDIKHEHFQ